MKYSDHSANFYALIRTIGATGKKAPMTKLLEHKRVNYLTSNYPIEVSCPACGVRSRFKTRRALLYACRKCCDRYSGGKFDLRFKFVIASSLSTVPAVSLSPIQDLVPQPQA